MPDSHEQTLQFNPQHDIKLGKVAHAYDTGTQDMEEAGVSEVQGHPWPHNEFEENLDSWDLV